MPKKTMAETFAAGFTEGNVTDFDDALFWCELGDVTWGFAKCEDKDYTPLMDWQYAEDKAARYFARFEDRSWLLAELAKPGETLPPRLKVMPVSSEETAAERFVRTHKAAINDTKDPERALLGMEGKEHGFTVQGLEDCYPVWCPVRWFGGSCTNFYDLLFDEDGSHAYAEFDELHEPYCLWFHVKP